MSFHTGEYDGVMIDVQQKKREEEFGHKARHIKTDSECSPLPTRHTHRPYSSRLGVSGSYFPCHLCCIASLINYHSILHSFVPSTLLGNGAVLPAKLSRQANKDSSIAPCAYCPPN